MKPIVFISLLWTTVLCSVVLCSVVHGDQKTENELYSAIQAGSDAEKVAAIETILKTPDQYSPLLLFASVPVAAEKKTLKDAAFLYYAAKIRVHFERVCFPPKGKGGNSPFTLFAAMSFQLGEVFNPKFMAEPKTFTKVAGRVKAFIPKVPADYDPGYEFVERKTEEAATKAYESDRKKYLDSMDDGSTLLNTPEWFAASRVIRAYNVNRGEDRPKQAEYAAAQNTIKRVEKEKGINLLSDSIEREQSRAAAAARPDGEPSDAAPE